MSEQANAIVRGGVCMEVSGGYFSNQDHGNDTAKCEVGHVCLQS